jgi:hypothetical protein
LALAAAHDRRCEDDRPGAAALVDDQLAAPLLQRKLEKRASLRLGGDDGLEAATRRWV